MLASSATWRTSPCSNLGANVPQAWAAGSVFSLLQAILGLEVDAPGGKLFIDPTLPEWLPDVTLSDLRMGNQLFDIRFIREGEQTRHEVLKGPAEAVIRRPATIWSE